MSKNTAKNSYTASNIQVLEGLEAVRKRPAMYIGDVGIAGLHHLVFEVVDNAIDEALAGHCTEVKVKIHPGDSISVEDNGRGIPTGMHPKEKRSALEVVLTVLHAGGKFHKDTYKVSGGLHGVGVSCVNALSTWLKAEVKREGQIFKQTYHQGHPDIPVQAVGLTTERGTKISFQPDSTIFGNTTYQYDRIASRLRELAFLNPCLTIELTDLRSTDEKGECRHEIFYSEEGLKEFIAYLDSSRKTILPLPIFMKNEMDGLAMEIAIMYNTGSSEHLISYANNINTSEGGTHVMGFKRGFTRAMKAYGEKIGVFERAKAVPSGDDFREGLTAILSVKISEPQFSGQEKRRLANEKVAVKIEPIVNREIQTFLEENPKLAKLIMEKGILAHQARAAARRARDLIQRKSALGSTSLPGKLTDCSEKDPAKCEIMLLEGDSAAGNVKGGRRPDTQAVLPLRGKILNIEKSQEYKLYESEQIRNIITALGVSFQDTKEGRITNLEKLRYHKIIIMTDADVDGSHIRTLILTLFFRHMPELITRGHVYIALPPLYLVKKGKNERYCWNDAERDATILEFAEKGKGEIMVQRYKGLGEMNEDQLWDTTLNPETRILKRVNISSAIEADRLFSILMGDAIQPRRELIEKHAEDVNMIDVI